MSAPPIQDPAPAHDPKLDATTASTSLPQAQLENLRYKITQIMESIVGLIVTLNAPQPNGVAGGLAAWPELMTKYNVLLSKTHSLAASLSAPPTRKGQTSLKAIAPHPYATDQPQPQTTPAPTPAQPALDPQHLEAMLDALLDGRRSQSVLRADMGNVARLRLPRDGAGGGGFRVGGVGVREGPMTADEARAEEARLDEVRKAHDARCARGVEAVRQLKDKYDWKSRLLFDDSDTDVGGTLDSESGTPHEGDEQLSTRGGEDEDEDEEMIEVAPEDDVPGGGAGVGGAGDMDAEDGTPTHTVFMPAPEDSDSESDEERPLSQPLQARGEPAAAVDVNGDGGGDGGDGSDSDGMEDVAPPFVPPIQTQYNGGTNGNGNGTGNAQAAPSPVSTLENLWVIDP